MDTQSFRLPGIVLITGASGFLGSEILRQALQAGMRARILTRHPGLERKDCEVVAGDIRNLDAVRAAMAGVTAVIHAAGLAHLFRLGPAEVSAFHEVNASGTRNVILAAREAHLLKVIQVSSVSVYGHHTKSGPTEADPCIPDSAYGCSKLAAELSAIELLTDSPVDLTILRLSTLYGEGDRGNVARLIRALDRDRFVWIGNGTNSKSLIHRRDAARACLLSLQSQLPGRHTFNVTAEPCQIHELVAHICRCLGKPLPRWRIPLSFVAPVAQAISAVGKSENRLSVLANQVRKFVTDDTYDGTRFSTSMSFSPEIELASGIQSQVRSYLAASRS